MHRLLGLAESGGDVRKRFVKNPHVADQDGTDWVGVGCGAQDAAHGERRYPHGLESDKVEMKPADFVDEVGIVDDFFLACAVWRSLH